MKNLFFKLLLVILIGGFVSCTKDVEEIISQETNVAKELPGNFTTLLGRNTIMGHGCSGYMEVWSRGVVYADRGCSSINLSYNQQLR